MLDLLPALYQSVSIAEAVLAESEAKARPDDPDLRYAGWLRVVAVVTPEDLVQQLDAGEAATIALAEQVQPTAVLLSVHGSTRALRQSMFWRRRCAS